MKRNFLAILFLAAGCALLGGCSSEKSSDAGTAAKKEEAAEDKLTVWAWDKAFNIYAMEEATKIYQIQNRYSGTGWIHN